MTLKCSDRFSYMYYVYIPIVFFLESGMFVLKKDDDQQVALVCF
jgi:hypothetical protein